jgi:hypothetical protein
MRLTAGGALGIGTTAPQTLLQVGDSTTGNGVPRIRVHRGSGSDYFEIDCTAGGTTLDTVGGGPFQISMGGSSAVYVDPSRRLLVGTILAVVQVWPTHGCRSSLYESEFTGGISLI